MSSVSSGDKLIAGVRRLDGFYYFVVVENSKDICRYEAAKAILYIVN